MKLDERIMQLLEERGMTQADLARASGLSTARIAYVCTGKTPDPRLKTVVAIADGLGVSMNELLREVD